MSLSEARLADACPERQADERQRQQAAARKGALLVVWTRSACIGRHSHGHSLSDEDDEDGELLQRAPRWEVQRPRHTTAA